MKWPLLLCLVSLCATVVVAEEFESLSRDGVVYQVFRVDAADRASLDLVWKDAMGQPLGAFGGLVREMRARNRQILFATNAGIFEAGPKPCGLTISAGKELVPLNLKEGYGNFYLKPNGVFFLDDVVGPGVMETAEYAAASTKGLRPRIATQSGPLLLRNGKVHPVFDPQSKNLRQRSGVGVRASDGQIVFLMSNRDFAATRRVSFHQFASAFLHLGCKDALFLDGDISQFLLAPDMKTYPTENTNTFAGMFVVTKGQP
ncbi:MAG: phosphodiester glycosidase family protein [Verrucomicrobiales bacterium]|nr:phosphodiester glycosidase family protein [Verrucomicrobiales bacterium]MCP5556904.1 phosphodiester glycosidase family protein [Verrucomicrobiaceae bacterium]